MASTCTVCGSSSVVVVKLVSAPGQPVYSHKPSLGRYFKMGTPFLFHCDVLQVARLGQPVSVRNVLGVYLTNQVPGYKIVIAP